MASVNIIICYTLLTCFNDLLFIQWTMKTDDVQAFVHGFTGCYKVVFAHKNN